MDKDTDKSLRIDRWLWFTRFYKTRGLAAAAVTGGHVRINGERAKPGSKVSAGDRIELLRDQLPYVMTAATLPQRRGPAIEARRCYIDDDETAAVRQKIREEIRRDRNRMPRTDGRPDKHTRRRLRAYNRDPGSTDQ